MDFLDLDFLTKLDTFLCVYGSRCSCVRWGSSAVHQAQVNPGVKGFHPLWRAVDLTFDNEKDLRAACQSALNIGFGGIEWDDSNQHLHLDNRQTLWHVVHHADKTETSLIEYLQSLSQQGVT